MPLSPPADRRLLHRRTVECIGYRRADGLFDIEGRLTDVKSYSFPNSYRGGEIRAGEPVHDMWVRLTLDADLLVHAAEAWTADGPYAVCGDVNDAYRSLAGVRIGPGWRRAIQERVGGVRGCVHITELLGPMATTAYQTIHGRRAEKPEGRTDPPARAPFFINSCHALSSEGEVVRSDFPQWFTGRVPETTEESSG